MLNANCIKPGSNPNNPVSGRYNLLAFFGQEMKIYPTINQHNHPRHMMYQWLPNTSDPIQDLRSTQLNSLEDNPCTISRVTSFPITQRDFPFLSFSILICQREQGFYPLRDWLTPKSAGSSESLSKEAVMGKEKSPIFSDGKR